MVSHQAAPSPRYLLAALMSAEEDELRLVNADSCFVLRRVGDVSDRRV